MSDSGRLGPHSATSVNTSPSNITSSQSGVVEEGVGEDGGFLYNGLTLYEENRKPRLPITDDSTITLQIRNLNVELTCPVCLGILHNCMTIMECLHRFCSNCISKSLRLGKKECPTCRVKCPSKRHQRPDPNFDAIIAQIYPNLEEFEAKEESFIEQINKNLMESGTLLESIQEGKRRQALAKTSRVTKKDIERLRRGGDVETRNKRQKKIQQSPEEKRSKRSFQQQMAPNKKQLPSLKKPESSETEKESPELSFVLLCHPAERTLEQLPNKYLRTSRHLTMRHLCKFLSKKFSNKEAKDFEIRLFPDKEKLEDEITLHFIERNLLQSSPEPDGMKLYYSLVLQ